MKKIWIVFLFVGLLFGAMGCAFPDSKFTISDSDCLYTCGKCGQKALMMNSTLRSQMCPQGETHEWHYNRK